MKIGILSMQRINNYGSFLQAYALQEILKSMGNQVVFVDIERTKKKAGFSRGKFIKVYLNKLKLIDRYLVKRIEYSKKNKQMNIMFIEAQKTYLGVTDEVQTSIGCDAVVIGSDEIFNCASDSFWGITSQRFGKIKGVPLTLSYAASCGFTDISMLSSSDKVIVKNALKQMKSISVRDQNTFEFVREISGRIPEINIDPVLVYDFKEEINSALLKGTPKYPYMIVYAYHNRIDNINEIAAIKNYATKIGLRTIAIGGSLPWCDEMAVINPFQVLAYFMNASCIVTDTFHGCVMATKFNKPLAVLVRNSNKNKLDDLLSRLQIRKHKVDNIYMLEKILEMDDDYIECNSIIKSEIEHTKKFLRNTLNNINL